MIPRINNMTLFGAMTVAVAIMVAGCSSSSSDSSATGPITQLGNVNISTQQYDGKWDVVASADFFKVDGDISQWAETPENINEDNCLTGDEFDDIDPELLALLENTTSISAGETLVLTSPNGTYATLLSATDEDRINYSAEIAGTVTPPPTGLTLDIPGDEFAAFSKVVIPDVPIINDFDYSAGDLTGTTTFTWTPSGEPNSYVSIFIAGGGLFSDDERSITCSVVDDGSFSLPAEAVAEFGSFENAVLFSVVSGQVSYVRSGAAFITVISSHFVLFPLALVDR